MRNSPDSSTLQSSTKESRHNLHNNKLFKCMQHSISLFEPNNNDTPVTFGLWSTLVSSLTYNRLGYGLPRRNNTESLNLLEPLKAIGLDLDAIPYTLSCADEISECLIEIYRDVKQSSFSEDGTMPANCSRCVFHCRKDLQGPELCTLPCEECSQIPPK